MSGINGVGRVLLAAWLLVIPVAGVAAAPTSDIDPLAVEGPVADAFAVTPGPRLAATVAADLNREMVLAEDAEREARGLPPRFAIPESVWLTPENVGTWENLGADYLLWRTRISAPGAASLNLAFTGFWLPPDSRLGVYPTDVTGPDDWRGQPVFTAADNADHGQLWTPVVRADDIVVELVLPRTERHNYRLELTAINQGYRFFGDPAGNKAGLCNIDVICGEGDDWRPEINSVGVISTGGSTFCTGVMMNNTAVDGTPYFLTANHCNIRLSNAPSLVVYWNFQSPVCGDQTGGLLDQFMSGATFLASSANSDFTLVEMDDPVDPAFGVTFAGWDRSSNDPVSAVAIHHPQGDEKSISFENDPTSTTSYLDRLEFDPLAHIKVTDWDLGTTEPGSSGSPLFDQNHRVVGQLHGGFAACGNDEPDWFGRLSVSWEGGGTPDSRLRDYLDPTGSGVMSLDLFDPLAASFVVTPDAEGSATGVVGGPFAPATQVYTVTAVGNGAVAFTVETEVDWLALDTTGGTLGVGQSQEVTATISAAAGTLPKGIYRAEIGFVNPTGSGTTSRTVVLAVTENALTLGGPVPNPFSVAPVTINYALRGNATVRARITNMRGMAIRDLGSFAGAPGPNVILWDGLDDHGHRVPSGVYALKVMALGREYRTNMSYVH